MRRAERLRLADVDHEHHALLAGLEMLRRSRSIPRLRRRPPGRRCGLGGRDPFRSPGISNRSFQPLCVFGLRSGNRSGTVIEFGLFCKCSCSPHCFCYPCGRLRASMVQRVLTVSELMLRSCRSSSPPRRPKAYSYIRRSTEWQLRGDSLRRQVDRSRAYAAEHGLDLDETTTFNDIGVRHFAART